MERIKQKRQLSSNTDKFQSNDNSKTELPPKRAKLNLTPEQQALIERNRQKALERYKERHSVAHGSVRDATDQNSPAVPNLQENKTAADSKPATKYIKPSVRKSEYIEYDFSTMNDTFGGFVSNKKLDKNGKPIEMSLNDWKNQQLEKKNNAVRIDDEDESEEYELPPMDVHDADKCHECKSLNLDKKMQEVFGCQVCKACKEKYPEKYSLLTKTECKEDYFLTEPELADLTLFKRIIKENPHSGTFSRMQLFLRYQIEEYAFKKWGSEEVLDKEWLRREEMKKNRREKRFNNKLKEMRKKLRAEELTRNLRAVRDKKHTHDWSAPVKKGEEDLNTYVKRCKDCGMEVEEILM